jgi:hypothetical protein
MSRTPVVTAIVSAYNEADVVGQVAGDLLDQGVRVYFLDHGSTDGTLAEVERLRGPGRVEVERFQDPPSTEPGRVSWAAILRRKQELAQSLDSDWFIHHDADEFRESPWPHLGLRAAIEEVDAFGYDAIDFELLNFWPTYEEGWGAGGDVREALRHFERARPWDKVQVRCWKKTRHPVDLVTSGGHEAVFPGRKVFPLRFLLRHYPFRSAEQAARKLTKERTARFLEAERARGWHRQYDDLSADALLRDAASLTPFDPARVRLDLVLGHRIVEDLQQVPAARERALLESERRAEELARVLDVRNREVLRLTEAYEAAHRELDRVNHDVIARSQALDTRNREVLRLTEAYEAAHRELDRVNHEVMAKDQALEARSREVEARNREVEDQNRELEERSRQLILAGREAEQLRDRVAALDSSLAAMRASRLWRWSAPLRSAADRLRGRG